MALTTLLRHIIPHNGNHKCKKGINVQLKKYEKGTRAHIAIKKSWIHSY